MSDWRAANDPFLGLPGCEPKGGYRQVTVTFTLRLDAGTTDAEVQEAVADAFVQFEDVADFTEVATRNG